MPVCARCRNDRKGCSNKYTSTLSACRRCADRCWPCPYPDEDTMFPSPSPKMPTRAETNVPTRRVLPVSHVSAPNEHTASISKILISCDMGTSNIKACYRCFYRWEAQDAQALQDSKFLSKCTTTITWPNGSEDCPAQLAFLPEDTKYASPLWDIAITKALENQQIAEDEIFQYIKPGLYDASAQIGKASKWHQDELISRLRKRLPQLVRDPDDTTSSSEDDESDVHSDRCDQFPGITLAERDALVHLWILFQRSIWLYIVNTLWDKYQDDLPWEPPETLSGYTKFDETMLGGCKLETALTVPAGADVKSVELALDSAKKAGIIDPMPLAEPSSAACYLLQNSFERNGKLPDARAYLFGDLGAGTFDCIAYKVSESTDCTSNDPRSSGTLSMKELIPGQTNWLGSATINKEFRMTLTKEMNVEMIVDELNSFDTGEKWTVSRLLSRLEGLFEEAKKRFLTTDLERGTHTVLSFDPLATVRYYKSHSRKMFLRGSRLLITPGCMEEIFRPCLEGMISLLDQQLKDLSTLSQASDASGEEPAPFVRHIQLVGGGSSSQYLCKKVRQAYRSMRYGYQIAVSQQPSARDSSLMVCWGALVLLSDKPFIGQRVSRRGYCFALDDVATGSTHEPGRMYRCDLTGRRMKKDAAMWLLRVGDRIGNGYSHTIRGIRLLKLGSHGARARFFCSERNEWYWKIDEILFSSDQFSKMESGIWVRSEDSGIEEIAVLRFCLYDSDVADVAVSRYHGKQFKEIDYESGFTIQGFRIEWFIRIPRSGKFDNPALGFIVRTGKILSCKGVFQLFEPAGKI